MKCTVAAETTIFSVPIPYVKLIFSSIRTEAPYHLYPPAWKVPDSYLSLFFASNEKDCILTV